MPGCLLGRAGLCACRQESCGSFLFSVTAIGCGFSTNEVNEKGRSEAAGCRLQYPQGPCHLAQQVLHAIAPRQYYERGT